MIDGKIIALGFDSDIYTPKIRHVNVGFRGMEGFTNDAIAIQGENSECSPNLQVCIHAKCGIAACQCGREHQIGLSTEQVSY